jgi:hypothetical protein
MEAIFNSTGMKGPLEMKFGLTPARQPFFALPPPNFDIGMLQCKQCKDRASEATLHINNQALKLSGI